MENNDFVAPTNFSPGSNSNFEEVCIDDRRTFRCLIPDCGKTFKFLSEMNRHQTIHSGKRPYACSFPDCGKTFKRADALSNHFSIHSGKISFNCPLKRCKAVFNTKSALRYHILKHKGVKAFQCSQPGCDKAFLTLTQLKQHEKATYYHQKIESAASQTEQAETSQMISSQCDETSSIPSRETPGFEQFETFEELQFSNFNCQYAEDLQLEDIPSNSYYPFVNDYNNIYMKRTYDQYEERPDETTTATPEHSTISYYSRINSASSMVGMMGFNFMMDEPAIQKKLRFSYDYAQQQQCSRVERVKIRQDFDVDLFFKTPEEFELEEGLETSFVAHIDS